MYLIGNFKRRHTYSFKDDNPMDETKIVNNISREDLAKAKDDDDFQIINLLKHEFYDPKKNIWQKINRD